MFQADIEQMDQALLRAKELCLALGPIVISDADIATALSIAKQHSRMIVAIAVRLLLHELQAHLGFEETSKYCNAILCGCGMSMMDDTDIKKM